ncbi:MAG: hypothetical protein MJZ90_02020 [Bacteroidales bacterium]|nr:hypothetical protein [Bacteroidales bacterium]
MKKLKIESRKLKVRGTAKSLFLVFLASLLLASCSRAYKPVGVKKRKKNNCDCSRWTYTEPQTLPAGTGSSGDTDLYVLDIV